MALSKTGIAGPADITLHLAFSSANRDSCFETWPFELVFFFWEKADTFEAALLQAPEKHWFLKRLDLGLSLQLLGVFRV